MISVCLPNSKSFFEKEVLANYLEDMKDYYEALTRDNDPEQNLISLEELKKVRGVLTY